MLVKRLQPLPIEAVVRGYLAGSGWKEYQAGGAVCGVKLPPGLQLASRLPEPIFTPATKAEAGAHDENIIIGSADRIAFAANRKIRRGFNPGSRHMLKGKNGVSDVASIHVALRRCAAEQAILKVGVSGFIGDFCTRPEGTLRLEYEHILRITAE